MQLGIEIWLDSD